VDHRQIVRILSVVRIVIGAALVVAPGAAGRRWIGDAATDPRVKVAVRGLGARDLALGLGALRALERGEPARGWVQLAAIGDTTDAVSGVLGARRLGLLRSVATVVTAGAAAALGYSAAERVDEGNRPGSSG
jgi:hypothetical protein